MSDGCESLGSLVFFDIVYKAKSDYIENSKKQSIPWKNFH